MSVDPVNSQPRVPPPTPPARTPQPTERSSFASTLGRAAAPPVPQAPPTEALASVQVAGKVYEELRAADRELHFERTAHGVRIDVYDGDGQLVQRVPATDVLKLADGKQTWLA
jgi:hypothetical protein